ncbi:hypothetical protein CYMTET_5487 [Cymbomonas tetramitiformis]|uniref:Uncharacterized protein n=1 Tax=Cymbomonas tetramitiformis TaxID=36881 RepID=A0AAE0GZA6_9CHLO|nr:hypothetical protein CYMTET_5487 [Cymbomonas tetramitiformis]
MDSGSELDQCNVGMGAAGAGEEKCRVSQAFRGCRDAAAHDEPAGAGEEKCRVSQAFRGCRDAAAQDEPAGAVQEKCRVSLAFRGCRDAAAHDEPAGAGEEKCQVSQAFRSCRDAAAHDEPAGAGEEKCRVSQAFRGCRDAAAHDEPAGAGEEKCRASPAFRGCRDAAAHDEPAGLHSGASARALSTATHLQRRLDTDDTSAFRVARAQPEIHWAVGACTSKGRPSPLHVLAAPHRASEESVQWSAALFRLGPGSAARMVTMWDPSVGAPLKWRLKDAAENIGRFFHFTGGSTGGVVQGVQGGVVQGVQGGVVQGVQGGVVQGVQGGVVQGVQGGVDGKNLQLRPAGSLILFVRIEEAFDLRAKEAAPEQKLNGRRRVSVYRGVSD